jgi:methanethiol S-methyltransferase
LLSARLQNRWPKMNWFSHDAGHLLGMTFRWRTNPHKEPFYVLSVIFLGGGFILIAAGWEVHFEARKRCLAYPIS